MPKRINKGWFKKGREVSEGIKKKISIGGKKHYKEHPERREKVGMINRGKPMSEEQKGKLRQANLKRWDIIGRKKYKRPNHNRWEYRNWKIKIFERDNFTCQKCKHRNKKGNRKDLRAHHKQNFAHYLKLRFVIDNGITFCKDCHDLFHKIYSCNNNTKEQVVEFLLDTCIDGWKLRKVE